MKYLCVTLRVVLALQLLGLVLTLSYCHARRLGELYAVLHEEPYLKINPDVVDPANEGRRVQVTAPAYTDEWLELRDIGVRCQALRLELCDSAYTQERSFMGLPLRSKNCHARNVRLGAFSLRKMNEYLAGHIGKQPLPQEGLNLPDAWDSHVRVEPTDDPHYLHLLFEGETPRQMRCCMSANGSVVVVRGVQRGSEISPIHGLYEDEMYYAAIDVSRRERAWWDTSLSLMMLLMQPALLLGIFRLVYWQKAGQSAPLAIWLMVLLDAGAALCFSGVVDGVWLGVAVMLAVLSVWNIVRIVRTFGVDGKPE